MQHPNYKHLYYFWVIAHEKSLTRAAERLHLTPQTLSGQLAKLEDYVGSPLFDRRGRSLALTVRHQKLHADGPDMPAGRGQPAEQRLAAFLLAEVKALRIELRGISLDVFGRERERAEFAALSDLHVLEIAHG